MDKPRILWIDDFYGKTRNGRNKDRSDLCYRLGLKDITGDCLPQNDKDEVVADVIFCQGQVKESGEVKNDLAITLEAVRNGWEQPPRWSLLLLDMHFAAGVIGANGELVPNPEEAEPERYFGLTILDSLWHDPELKNIPIVITSGMERDEIEHRFTTQGVWDFVDRRDLNEDKLKELLNDHGLLPDDKIIGHSLPLLQCLREARRRARMPNENILILGESGTEKELLAKYIHKQSGREGKYVSFSQVREETLEEELSKDAESADGGTLFIDNFDDISVAADAKLPQLLRKICNRDLQVIMAIEREEILFEENFHKALPDGAQIHNFIRIPTLSQRVEDIPLLVNYFVKKYEREYEAEQREVSEKALEALRAYPWPSNVRELENVIRHAIFTYRELRRLEVDHLNLPSYETHIPPMPSNQPNSSDLFNIIYKDDSWEQLRESIGEMAIWLQDMAIWVYTEKALRRAIETILADEFGRNWITSVGRTDPTNKLRKIFEDCEEKQGKYSQNYPGEISDLPDLINFTDPSDLFNIILNRPLWDLFSEFFGRNDPTEESYRRWYSYWRVAEAAIVYRVRNLMNHSNPDLIPSYDHDTFKGFCGEIFEICQKIETVLSEQGQQLESELPISNAMDRDQEGIEQEEGEQEELYEGKVKAILPDGVSANVDVYEHPDLTWQRVPKNNFKDEGAFALGEKVKFKVEKKGQDFRVYDVFLAEGE